jgi:hypothetical protein
MFRSPFDVVRRAALLSLPATLLLIPSAGGAQEDPAVTSIISHEVSIARNSAVLELELTGGRELSFSIEDGQARIDGEAQGTASAELARSWRELLNRAIDAPATELPQLLRDWNGDGAAGEKLDAALEAALLAAELPAGAPAPISDSLIKLQERIAELEAQRAELDSERAAEEHGVRVHVDREPWERGDRLRGPFHYLGRGLGGVFSTLMVYVVLFTIGLATIVFGGRKYIEGVADTARNATLRSFMVGIAGAFLTLPAFILGIIALAISIVGIPALLLWVPLFPLAVVAALLLGYLAVAHACGEALAERRLYGNQWFERGNSYYFLVTGLGLLLAFFIGSAVVSMGGPWLGFISGLLKFLAVMVTWAAFSIGFGAVLLSRAGTQPVRADGRRAEPDLFTDGDAAGDI